MKKFYIFMCIALVGLCASAQEKGDMTVGLNLGVAPCIESGASVTNFGIGAKFQYNITNPIRLETDVNYGFKNKGVDVLEVSANAHYLFNLSDKFSVYPLIGLGYAYLGGGMSDGLADEIDGILNDYGFGDDEDEDFDGGSSSASKFLLNVGVGVQYALNKKLSLGAEVKYQYIKDFSRLPISIGVTYKF